MNVVFNLESVQELMQVANALENVATLQSLVFLKREIIALEGSRRELSGAVQELRGQRDALLDSVRILRGQDKDISASEDTKKVELVPSSMGGHAAMAAPSLSSDTADVIIRVMEENQRENESGTGAGTEEPGRNPR